MCCAQHVFWHMRRCSPNHFRLLQHEQISPFFEVKNTLLCVQNKAFFLLSPGKLGHVYRSQKGGLGEVRGRQVGPATWVFALRPTSTVSSPLTFHHFKSHRRCSLESPRSLELLPYQPAPVTRFEISLWIATCLLGRLLLQGSYFSLH